MTSVILRSINRSSDSIPVSSFKSFEVKIELPLTLGRGPIIKCPDKKISRNHVMIDWDDEGVLITSTHVKPTFIVRNGEEESLTQGQSVVLKNGDSFGLLKDSYWYKIVVESSGSDERVTDSKKIQKESSPCSKRVQKESSLHSETVQKESSECLSSTKSPTDKNINDPIGTCNHEVELNLKKENNINEENIEQLISSYANTKSIKTEDRIEGTDEKEDEIEPNLSETSYNPNNNRKRTLPDWMRKPTRNEETEEKKSKGKVNLNEKHSKKRNVSRPSKKITPPSKLHDCSDDDSADYNAEVSPKKPTKKVIEKQIKQNKVKNQYHTVSQDFDSPDFGNEDNVPKVINKNLINANGCRGSDGGKESPKKVNLETKNNVSEALSKNDVESNNKNVADMKEIKPYKKEHNLSDDDDDVNKGQDEPSGSKPTNIKISKEPEKNTPRSSCQYGEDCYRRNPKHREEIAHPGDSDYVSYKSASDDDEDDDRPECEYGLNCYRKNPQHKKDFKHTKKPQPPRNAKRKGKRKKDDSDDSDEYDFDDPFLNDDSSDDYAPTDSSGPDSDIEDAVEEEDTKRMIKEAKKFVKKRKY